MSKDILTSVTNPKVKQWSSLKDKKGRARSGCFLVEGPHLVMEALASSFKVNQVVFDASKGIPQELRDHAQSDWVAVSETVMRKCTDTVEPQGIFAIVEKQSVSLETLLTLENPLIVVVDGVRDPGNLGTIIRSADAAGADGIILGQGTTDLFNPKTVRSTMGSMFHLPIVTMINLPQALSAAKMRHIRCVSASLDAKEHCFAYNFKGAVWIIVGNEAHGVSDSVEAEVTDRVYIPMKGGAESLNVAMATTVLLYEAMRQRLF